MSRRTIVPLLAAAALTLAAPSMAEAQGKSKRYAISTDRAVVVTRDVLAKQGFEVVRIEESGPTRVVYYRRGSNGKGKGKGPVQKLVIRTVERRIVFEETPPDILVDIDLRLRL
ncbi:MAG TPA: hypothetical protein VNK43_12605 [Gemmatimonadales bacterium]|nr:hypothetical protein [Gemmatimonadales bacterium]